jgi:hypothetical protein
MYKNTHIHKLSSKVNWLDFIFATIFFFFSEIEEWKNEMINEKKRDE